MIADFTGKTAVITGGASGIGFGLARAFARRGMNVMLLDREAEPLAAAVETLKAMQAKASGIAADVADLSAMKDAQTKTEAEFGPVHILCNNAGVGGGGRFGDMAPEVWKWVLDVNLNGVFNGLSAFLPAMKAHGQGGHIVNTASMAGLIGTAGGAYAATKFAVVGMSQVLREELRAEKIGVSVLCPGFVATRIVESGRNAPDTVRDLAAHAPPPSKDDIARFTAMKHAIDTGLDPEVVGRRVIECIETDTFYAITHPSWWPAVEARQSEVKLGFDAAKDSPALQGTFRDEMELARSLASTRGDEQG
jgi:NAD(P)-dependent dehydrogenase (short-subunit alcohol dehydrogenase family)